MKNTGSKPLTVGEVIDLLLGESRVPSWPPDVFGVCTCLLSRSGAYTAVINSWPPPVRRGKSSTIRERAERWVEDTEGTGLKWRANAASDVAPPRAVIDLWAVLVGAAGVQVANISSIKKLTDALLQLTAIADEACRGVGIPGQPSGASADTFEQLANLDLITRATLCRRIEPSRLRVLPKLHNPQFGMTVRSLTHHICMVEASEVRPEWFCIPGGPAEYAGLNLLLVPWPRRVVPSQFAPVTGDLANMPEEFGFFSFEPRLDPEATTKHVVGLYERASKVVGRIHGVVFPELALTPRQHAVLRTEIAEKRHSFLISGVASTNKVGLSSNHVSIEFPTPAGVVTLGPQHKHHRWQLDSGQILQYGLGANLNHRKRWWEHIAITERTVTFLAINPWLTVTVLICEDLARQDPVAQIVRSVGPNLVIALLMDGPQLKARWSARYATVLADDPGCSVLSLTSLGMSLLSRPFGDSKSLRNVALWKDAKSGGPIEVVLPDGADAVVLTLSAEFSEEWTADGRSDGGSTGYPVLAGIHPISLAAS
jgi:hypothetical protein